MSHSGGNALHKRSVFARLTSLTAYREQLERKLLTTQPRSSLHHLLPPPRDPALLSRLRTPSKFPRTNNRTKNINPIPVPNVDYSYLWLFVPSMDNSYPTRKVNRTNRPRYEQSVNHLLYHVPLTSIRPANRHYFSNVRRHTFGTFLLLIVVSLCFFYFLCYSATMAIIHTYILYFRFPTVALNF